MLSATLLLSCIMQRSLCLDRLLASLPTQFHQACSTGNRGLLRYGRRAADCQCSLWVSPYRQAAASHLHAAVVDFAAAGTAYAKHSFEGSSAAV